MANISFFYPDKRKGLALGLNAAGGNIGVAFVQLVVPVAIGVGFLGAGAGLVGPLLGDGQGDGLSLQNAGLMFVPLIVLAAACAWVFMDNLVVSRSGAREQAVVARNKHTWIMAWLYIGTFGSFIGYSAGLPLLIKTQFPDVSYGVGLAFLGPLVGSLVRPLGGWMSDRWSGTRVTFATFAAMIVAVLGVLFCLGSRDAGWAFPAFLGTFMVLFVLTGVGNGSTFRMIPVIFRVEALREADGDGAEARALAVKRGRREAAAVLGFTSAVGAYGGWLIPQGYGVSTASTGGPATALLCFVGFYVTCLGLTWWHYIRRPSEAAGPSRVPSVAEARA
jgi:NNP family nitrate/nitrite transporter-like MFS transporter